MSDRNISHSHPQNSGVEVQDEEALAARAVIFPNDHGEIHEEKILHGHVRPRGAEMKREWTKEDMELAAAGYEYLEGQKVKGKKGVDTSRLDDVDIQEHRLTFQELEKALTTSLDTKDPSQSEGCREGD